MSRWPPSQLQQLASAESAVNGLFTGANIGKTVVKVGEPTPA